MLFIWKLEFNQEIWNNVAKHYFCKKLLIFLNIAGIYDFVRTTKCIYILKYISHKILKYI